MYNYCYGHFFPGNYGRSLQCQCFVTDKDNTLTFWDKNIFRMEDLLFQQHNKPG